MRAQWVMKGAYQWEPYNLATNNCEHFATWCKTGSKTSKQVQVTVGGALLTVAGLALVGGLAYVAVKDKNEKKREKNQNYYYS